MSPDLVSDSLDDWWTACPDDVSCCESAGLDRGVIFIVCMIDAHQGGPVVYGRFGNPVEVLRYGTLDDVRQLDGRKPDARDKKSVEARSYVVVRDIEAPFQMTLAHIAYLRADDGLNEIMAAVDGPK
jgi:hypothetical protein